MKTMLQFSLKRLMVAVTCFAVAFASYAYAKNYPIRTEPFGFPPIHVWIPSYLLTVVMPGVGVGVLCDRLWFGVAVTAFLIFVSCLL